MKNYHEITNPATGEITQRLLYATSTECENAIQKSLAAWPAWSQTTPTKRAQIFFNFRQLLITHQNELAQLVTREHGKTLTDALGSISRGIEVVEEYCGLLNQLQGTYSNQVAQQIECYTFRQPLGVCVGISPFNFPIMVPIWMMIPAIACGNTFILKPSEQTPSAPVRLIALLQEAGLPADVAQCLHGNQATVDYLLQHPHTRAFTAVASTPVAKYIYAQATAAGKRAHTFGGAKNHAVVMPDADFSSAAQAIVGAGYGSAGERCMALSVIVLVGKETREQLLQHMIPSIQAIRIDQGEAPDCDMGPLVSQAHRARVLKLIDTGIAEKAQLLIDGRGFKHPKHPNGFYLGPSLFDHVTTDMTLYQEEIFGPVLCLIQVDSLSHAIHLINQNPYGNGTAVFTRDGGTAHEFSQKINVGMVGINIPIPVPVASHPFGGWKNSSFGDTPMHAQESIRFYTQTKTVTQKWPQPNLNQDGFVMPTHRD